MQYDLLFYVLFNCFFLPFFLSFLLSYDSDDYRLLLFFFFLSSFLSLVCECIFPFLCEVSTYLLLQRANCRSCGPGFKSGNALTQFTVCRTAGSFTVPFCAGKIANRSGQFFFNTNVLYIYENVNKNKHAVAIRAIYMLYPLKTCTMCRPRKSCEPEDKIVHIYIIQYDGVSKV